MNPFQNVYELWQGLKSMGFDVYDSGAQSMYDPNSYRDLITYLTGLGMAGTKISTDPWVARKKRPPIKYEKKPSNKQPVDTGYQQKYGKTKTETKEKEKKPKGGKRVFNGVWYGGYPKRRTVTHFKMRGKPRSFKINLK